MTDKDVLELAFKYATVRLKKARRYFELHQTNEEARNLYAHWESIYNELLRRKRV